MFGSHVRAVGALLCIIANKFGVIVIDTMSSTAIAVKGFSVFHSVDRIDETVANVSCTIGIAKA